MFYRYFVSMFLQFQFLKSLCDLAGEAKGPLYKCDFYESMEAGDALK